MDPLYTTVEGWKVRELQRALGYQKRFYMYIVCRPLSGNSHIKGLNS